jgi:FAD/FMN-containing dehydrogenase
VITEAWMRLQERPEHKASASVSFGTFAAALEAVRAIAQSGPYPANCRLLDLGEAAMSGAGTDGRSVLGFESARAPVDGLLGEAVELVNCRLTHVYPDGAAPYFTVIAAGRRGSELAMWDEIKTAATELLGRHRATVTHHHAVGRDHRPGYDRQRPEPFALALRAAKDALDPHGVLNPGVLIG